MTAAGLQRREFLCLTENLSWYKESLDWEYEAVTRNKCRLTFTWNNTNHVIAISYFIELGIYTSVWAYGSVDDDDWNVDNSHSLEKFDKQAPLLFFVADLFKRICKDHSTFDDFLIVAENFVVANHPKPELVPREYQGRRLDVEKLETLRKSYETARDQTTPIERRFARLERRLVETETEFDENENIEAELSLEFACVTLVLLKYDVHTELKVARAESRRKWYYWKTVEDKLKEFDSDVENLHEQLKLSKQLEDGKLILKCYLSKSGSFYIDYPVKPTSSSCPMCDFKARKVEFVVRVEQVPDGVSYRIEGSGNQITIELESPTDWRLGRAASGDRRETSRHKLTSYLNCKNLPELLEKEGGDIVEQHYMSCPHLSNR